jgi:hypothetical protein
MVSNGVRGQIRVNPRHTSHGFYSIGRDPVKNSCVMAQKMSHIWDFFFFGAISVEAHL